MRIALTLNNRRRLIYHWKKKKKKKKAIWQPFWRQQITKIEYIPAGRIPNQLHVTLKWKKCNPIRLHTVPFVQGLLLFILCEYFWVLPLYSVYLIDKMLIKRRINWHSTQITKQVNVKYHPFCSLPIHGLWISLFKITRLNEGISF